MTEKAEITWHDHRVRRDRGCVVWFTGLSGSGKSTVANAVDELLADASIASYVLDGDNIRHGLNASSVLLEPIYGSDFARRFGLGFSAEDRQENIRRIGAVAELFCAAGTIALTAFVSPYRSDRDRVRRHVVECGSTGDFVEIFVDTPLELCQQRDPKGLYKKAAAGDLTGMTGIDAPYEPPHNPDLVLRPDDGDADQMARRVFEFLQSIEKLKTR